MGLPGPLLPSSFPAGESSAYTVCEMVHEISVPSGMVLELSIPSESANIIFWIITATSPHPVLGKIPLVLLQKKNPKICRWEFCLVHRVNFLGKLVSFACLLLSADMPVDQPNTNVWLALDKLAGSNIICLTNSNPDKPFATCLVDVPVPAKEWPIPNHDNYWCEAV